MTDAGVERRLAAIMAMDVVSYSRLMGTDEVGTVAALKAHRAELIDTAVATHRGRIVKTTGDGLLLEFASVVDAIACAVAIQRGMLERNAQVPEDKQLVFRVGINIGDVIIDGEDILGDGVNVAARLEALCEPGGIYISRAANEQVRDKLVLSFADLGEHTVKNIARSVGVFGLSASAIAALSQEVLNAVVPAGRTAAPAAADGRRRGWLLPVALAAALLVPLIGAAAWYFTGGSLKLGPRNAAADVEGVLAASVPGLPELARRQIAAAYVQTPANRAIAVARRAGKLRYVFNWPSREAAEEKALEKCQQQYDELCVLVAVNETMLPAGRDGAWPERDAPRVRYAGTFNLERIPTVRPEELRRADIAGYAAAPQPKAMAFNVAGLLAAVSGASSQRVAEEQALQLCLRDQRRKPAEDGPCYLYAVENRVVLPLRSMQATSLAQPAAAGEVALRARIAELLAGLEPNLSLAAREAQAAAYHASPLHRALVARPGTGIWRSASWPNAALAEERALEACQVRYGAPCVLVAVNDQPSPPDVLTRQRPMPRADYAGAFDVELIPVLSDRLRRRADIVGYRDTATPKAAAIHPLPRFVVVTGAPSQREAEERALAQCNAELSMSSTRGDIACLLYASGDQVVLTKRSQRPLTP